MSVFLWFKVHERDKETDFCLLIVRKLLMTNSPHVKVILMSATFETAYFARYFSMPTPNGISHPPVIKVEASPHPVHVFYLDDIKRIGRVRPIVLIFILLFFFILLPPPPPPLSSLFIVFFFIF